MKKHQATIIINGQLFNALTGRAVNSSDNRPDKALNVDGILPQNVTPVALVSPWRNQPMPSPIKKPIMDFVRSPPVHGPKRRAQPGQTLMRSTLKKPQPSFKRTTKVMVANSKKAGVTIANLSIKHSATSVDDKKLNHAKLVAQSTSVRRFTPLTYVQPAKLSLNSVAAKQASASRAMANNHANQPNLDLFERALATAVSHKQTTPAHVNKSLKSKRKGVRSNRLVASTLAILLIAGFVGYQNLPNLKFQYASSQAGFRADLPDYQPPGFSVGKLTYETGAVQVNYTSNSDNRSFAITQQPSAWDNQALRDNYFSKQSLTYELFETDSRVLYVYGANNATWVNDGVWYDLKSNGSLTNQQLARIADSL